MWEKHIITRADYHLQKQHKNVKGREIHTHDARRQQSSNQFFFPLSFHASTSYIICWAYILYSYSGHKLLWYILSEYMDYHTLSSRQMLSEHICLASNFCASWWNKTSVFKFVLCFYCSVYSSCYFSLARCR